ncbi:MAG: asparagine synthase (glutamine-hydrolyzing), partial [Alphaproteobacteria bacterium]
GDSDRAAGYACAQRRLSIIDLSPLGHQPMTSACGRYVLVYNGEIYNHDDLRADLEAQGVRFRGRSDTEVLLEALARWGVAATLPRLIGMFAIALWDREARRLTLVRDRMGIKPLYWHRGADGLVLFASELKALRAVSGWVPKLDPHAVGQYFALAYIPAPRTVYLGVQKLLPGSLVTIEADGAVAEQRWWDLRDVVRNGLAARASGSSGSSAAADLAPEAITDRLEALVADACRLRMIADRPLGAFLSGGIDSATVLAAMVAQSSVPVRSFTIGFTEPNYDEAPYAAQIARHLGSDHTEMTVTPQDALDLIPSLPAMYDEPFADSSQIPTHLLSKMTQQHVTVALSGDGGDEVFAGYNRHVWT